MLSTVHIEEPTVPITDAENTIKMLKTFSTTSQERLIGVYGTHNGIKPNQLDPTKIPFIQVNFATHEVIAVFAGDAVDSGTFCPIKIVRIDLQEAIIYQKSRYSIYNSALECAACLFIVLSRTNLETIVIEQIETDDS